MRLRLSLINCNLQKIFHSLIFLLIISFLFSCKEEKLIPEDKLINIYVDILTAQDTVESASTDSIKTLVLSRYSVSDSLYYKTIQFYNQHPKMWEKFFDRAIEHVEKLKAKQK